MPGFAQWCPVKQPRWFCRQLITAGALTGQAGTGRCRPLQARRREYQAKQEQQTHSGPMAQARATAGSCDIRSRQLRVVGVAHVNLLSCFIPAFFVTRVCHEADRLVGAG